MNATLFTHENMGDGIVKVISPLGEQMYLVIGEEKAALIDTGLGIGSLRSYVERITDKPVIVINTHGHPDHAGGNIEFDAAYMHPADARWYEKMVTRDYRAGDIRIQAGERAGTYLSVLQDTAAIPQEIADEASIDLGGRSLRVLLTPGHTPGGICLLDEACGALFAGDCLSAGSVWVYDFYSESLQTYVDGLKDLQKRAACAKRCFVGHPPGEIPMDTLQRTIDCAERILCGKGIGTYEKTFAGEGLLYRYGGSAVLYNPEKLFG